MSESRLQTAITVIPVITAVLYLLGTAYYQGYLAGFGLEDSLFPLATDRSLFSGFVAFVSFGAVPTVYAVSAIFIFCFVILFAAILSSTERVKRLQAWVKGKLRSLHLKSEPSPAMIDLVDKTSTVYYYAAGILLVF